MSKAKIEIASPQQHHPPFLQWCKLKTANEINKTNRHLTHRFRSMNNEVWWDKEIYHNLKDDVPQ